MKAALFQHGNQVKGKDDCLVSCLSRLKEVVDIKITTDSFCNFAAILVLIIVSGLSQSFIGARRGGCGTKYVDLHLVLLGFITEIFTPPQEPKGVTVFSRYPNLVEHLFYVCNEDNLFLTETHKDAG